MYIIYLSRSGVNENVGHVIRCHGNFVVLQNTATTCDVRNPRPQEGVGFQQSDWPTSYAGKVTLGHTTIFVDLKFQARDLLR